MRFHSWVAKLSAIPCARAGLAFALCLLCLGAASPDAPRAEFRVVDVWMECGDGLAAWQLQIEAQQAGITLVGVEGVASEAYPEPPYYDPAALQGGTIILGAFSLKKATLLPQGRVRVARLHLLVEDGTPLHFLTKVMAAADSEGRSIHAAAQVEER